MEQREVSPIRSGVRTASIIAVEDFANLAAQVIMKHVSLS